MKTYKILVTYRMMISFLEKNINILPKNFVFDYYKVPQALNSFQLKNKIKSYDGLICGDDEVDQQVLNKAKNLKVISKWGTGLDSIDVKLCNKYGVKVFNTPGAFTESVAQMAFAFILGFSRDIFKTHHEIKKRNKWPKISGHLLKSQTLGIIGLGKIGLKLAQYAFSLKMKVFFYDVKNINHNKYKKVDLKYLMANSDYICLCCDLNKTSYNLLNFSLLNKIKKDCSLINISRGKLIKEKDLILALKKGLIKNVALDVFDEEPLKKSNSLRKFENVILSSHNAFNTYQNVENVNKNTLKNLLKVLK
jgi:D-3-phosphoglycerate dehydrogenase